MRDKVKDTDSALRKAQKTFGKDIIIIIKKTDGSLLPRRKSTLYCLNRKSQDIVPIV